MHWGHVKTWDGRLVQTPVRELETYHSSRVNHVNVRLESEEMELLGICG